MDCDFELQSVMGDFIKLSGSTKNHLMAPKLTNMWQHVRVDYITADVDYITADTVV